MVMSKNILLVKHFLVFVHEACIGSNVLMTVLLCCYKNDMAFFMMFKIKFSVPCFCPLTCHLSSL